MFPSIFNSPESINLFNPGKPYQSIVSFVNMHEALEGGQKGETYLVPLEKFFSDKAYNDILISIVPQKNGIDILDFIQYDAPALWSLLDQIDVERGKIRGNQLLANIAKVAGIVLDKMSSPDPIYQINVADGPNDLWGWIEGRYVASSPKLLESKIDGHIKIGDAGVKPSLLLAVQHLQSCKIDKKSRTLELELSIEEFLELVVFAYKYEITLMQEELHEIYEKIDRQRKDDGEYHRAVEGFDPSCINPALDALEKVKISSQNRFVDVEVINMPYHHKVDVGSPMFNKGTPYASIIKFAGRCCTLSGQEQRDFFSAVRRFFTIQAFTEKKSKIPKKLEEAFSVVALPFLLETMQHKEHERQRLLADIQFVANRSFPNLKSCDQLLLIKNRYVVGNSGRVQIGWVRASETNKDRNINGDNDCPPPEFLEVNSSGIINFTALCSDEDLDMGGAGRICAALIVALELGIKSWGNKLVPALLIKLEEKNSGEELSTLLVKELKNPLLFQFIDKDINIDLLHPRIEALNSEDVDNFIKLRFKKTDLDKNSFVGQATTAEKKIILQCFGNDIMVASHEQVVAALMIAIKYENGELEKTVIDEITKRLNDYERRAGISTLLVKRIDESSVQGALWNIPVSSLNPRMSDVSDAELCSLACFRLRLNKGKLYSDVFRGISDERLFGVAELLQEAEKSDTLAGELQEYFKNWILNKVPNKKSRQNRERDFIKAIFDDLREHIIMIENMPWIKGGIELKMRASEIQKEDLSSLCAFLQEKSIVSASEKAGLGKVRETIVKGMEEVDPTITVMLRMDDLMEQFFAASKPAHRPLIEELLKASIEEGSLQKLREAQFSERNSLEDEAILAIYKVLKGDDFEPWLKEHMPRVSCLSVCVAFEKLYNTDLISIILSLLNEANEIDKKNSHKREKDFLGLFLRRLNSSINKDEIGGEIRSLILEQKITTVESQWIGQFLAREKVKALFPISDTASFSFLDTKTLYPIALSKLSHFTEHFRTAPDLSGRFVKAFTFQEDLIPFVKNMLEFVYCNGQKGDWQTCNAIEKQALKRFPGEDVALLWRQLSRQDVSEWLQKNAGEAVCTALVDSVKTCCYRITVHLEIYDFVVEAQKCGKLQDLGLCGHVKAMLRRIGAQYPDDLRNEEKQNKMNAEIKKDLAAKKFISSQIAEIRDALRSNYACTSLKTDGLSSLQARLGCILPMQGVLNVFDL